MQVFAYEIIKNVFNLMKHLDLRPTVQTGSKNTKIFLK